MRIAQIAPLTESVPPKLYGGTERIVSYLTEELTRLGHEVTLFASGDSVILEGVGIGAPTNTTLYVRVIDPYTIALYANKSEALETIARLSRLVAPEPPPADAPPLPKCRDRDDQKFLELAHASRADWLVSKDRAVLKLAKRTARDFGFRIAQPAPFVASFEAHIEAYEESNKETNAIDV